MADGNQSKIEIPAEVFRLYDAYCHGDLSRRAFFSKLSTYAVGGLTVSMLAACVMPDYGRAQTAEGEPDLIEETAIYPSPNGAGEMSGYLVRPAKAKGKLAGITVVHENRGLNPHIEDVTRRLALEGYLVLAPDALYPLGGYPGNDEAGRELQSSVDGTKLMNDFFAAIDFLMAHDDTTGKVGITGFCYGGGVSNAAAVAYPELACAVPFYGRQAAAEDVPRINAPILLHYAELDTRVNEGWPAYEAALKAAGKTYEAHIYPGANHGFHNDSTPRYDEAAAKLAWDRTLDWFAKYLT